VNAAANEAPTPEVARRVKTKLDPSDVLAELQAKSPFLAEANREAESHAFAIASLREALEKMDGTASAETIEALRDRAEQTLAALTDEPRVLRLLEFPEARLESLRVAAANAKRLSECRKRAEIVWRARFRLALQQPRRCSRSTHRRSPSWTRAFLRRTPWPRRAARTSVGSATPASPSIGV
jgi:hypothetical protein